MVKISNTTYENEIHMVDDSKNIIFLAKEAIISEESRPENIGKMAKNSEIYCYAN